MIVWGIEKVEFLLYSFLGYLLRVQKRIPMTNNGVEACKRGINKMAIVSHINVEVL